MKVIFFVELNYFLKNIYNYKISWFLEQNFWTLKPLGGLLGSLGWPFSTQNLSGISFFPYFHFIQFISGNSIMYSGTMHHSLRKCHLKWEISNKKGDVEFFININITIFLNYESSLLPFLFSKFFGLNLSKFKY